jgi:hypothetical protein
MKSSLALVMLLVLGGLTVAARAPAVAMRQTASSPGRAEAEKAARGALYEMSLATQGGDAAKFKKFAAQRTLGLYDRVFSELETNPKVKEQLMQAGVTSGEKLLELGLRAVAKRAAGVPAEKLQEYAREQAAIPLTFNGDKEATGETQAGPLKLVLEKGEWKIDVTETLKKPLLQSLPLSADSRARLEKY